MLEELELKRVPLEMQKQLKCWVQLWMQHWAQLNRRVQLDCWVQLAEQESPTYLAQLTYHVLPVHRLGWQHEKGGDFPKHD